MRSRKCGAISVVLLDLFHEIIDGDQITAGQQMTVNGIKSFLGACEDNHQRNKPAVIVIAGLAGTENDKDLQTSPNGSSSEFCQFL